ncbi:MAG: hypothetical protein WA885_03285 [Phormidesmis sp.]
MLTFYHCLLGGFIAVSCATSVFSSNADSSQIRTQASAEETSADSLEIAYRGSGRVEDEPIEEKRAEQQSNREKGPIAHRGSGRVIPHLL